ncbi:MAG: hypothetical protein HYX39_04445 [Bacteroidetes bacterium]|nr:hypothetical protein [Bacteroidota bacterium]
MNYLIIISALLFSFSMNAKHKKLNLQKAIDARLVKAKALSRGGYQGYCINLNLINSSPDSLIVVVEAGRRLNSCDDKNQDILIVKEETILLSSLENKWVKVKGYCCQASNHSPQQNASYAINKLADSALVTLARFLNVSTFDENIEQQAIWAISDKKLTANIAGVNDSLALPLRKLVAGLKNEPLPWYTILSKVFVYQSGAMVTFPQKLKGKLNYSNPSDGYVTLFLLDKNGKEVCLIKSQWLKACANENYELNVPVKGLAKGKYTIGLKSQEKELTKMEFEI